MNDRLNLSPEFFDSATAYERLHRAVLGEKRFPDETMERLIRERAEALASVPHVSRTPTEDLFKAQLERQLEGLPERQKEVMRLRYGIPQGPTLSLRAIGREIGVSKSTVARDERAALLIIRSRPRPSFGASAGLPH